MTIFERTFMRDAAALAELSMVSSGTREWYEGMMVSNLAG
jgi:hypothetical protein